MRTQPPPGGFLMQRRNAMIEIVCVPVDAKAIAEDLRNLPALSKPLDFPLHTLGKQASRESLENIAVHKDLIL